MISLHNLLFVISLRHSTKKVFLVQVSVDRMGNASSLQAECEAVPDTGNEIKVRLFHH